MGRSRVGVVTQRPGGVSACSRDERALEGFETRNQYALLTRSAQA
jgi:hypothetical protein